MKKQILMLAFTALFSTVFIACGGKQNAETEVPVDEAVEIVEVKTCCKLDTTAKCADSVCDTTTTCKEQKGACADTKACNGSSNCSSKK